jgi:hypothetical protein
MKRSHQTYPRSAPIRSWRCDDVAGRVENISAHQCALKEAERIFGTPADGRDDPYARARTERALLSERRKRRAGHRTYDLRRHITLARLHKEGG